jgi:hypothetical protein
MLGLTVATVVFGASSLYLWRQLSVERDRAAQVEQTTQKLNARIAVLENSRVQFDQRRVGNPNTYVTGTFGNGSAPGGPLADAVPVQGNKEGSGHNVWSSGPGPEMPQAMKRMMRAQMRTHNKRVYADVGESLGLSKDTAAKLIELISDQQAFGLDAMREGTDSAHQFEDIRRQQDAAIADLIGPEKMQAWTDYQQSMPARQDFEMIANQLDSSEVSLTPDQSKKLLAAYVEERGRVPMPQWTEGGDNAEYAKSVTAWQEDYNRRVADEADRILNPEQLTAYNDIQQWQKEMREQLTVVTNATPVATAGTHPPRGFTAVTFTSNGALEATTSSELPAPPSAPAGKSRKQ